MNNPEAEPRGMGNKHVYAYTLDPFKEVWTTSTSGRIFASPVGHGGSLWIGSNDGKLYELDPSTGRVCGYF